MNRFKVFASALAVVLALGIQVPAMASHSFPNQMERLARDLEWGLPLLDRAQNNVGERFCARIGDYWFCADELLMASLEQVRNALYQFYNLDGASQDSINSVASDELSQLEAALYELETMLSQLDANARGTSLSYDQFVEVGFLDFIEDLGRIMRDIVGPVVQLVGEVVSLVNPDLGSKIKEAGEVIELAGEVLVNYAEQKKSEP